MKKDGCFNLTHRYGVKFTSDDAAICGRGFLKRLMDSHKDKLIAHPELYTYALKFIIKLCEIAPKTQKKPQVENLGSLVDDLLTGKSSFQNFNDQLEVMLINIKKINNEKQSFFFSKGSYMQKFLDEAIKDFAIVMDKKCGLSPS